jgi:hypothetical protein
METSISIVINVTTTGLSSNSYQNEYVLDGVKCPRLVLPVKSNSGQQMQYIFKIDAPGCPMYITTNAIGGGNDMAGQIDEIAAVEVGDLTVVAKDAYKNMRIYYQCDRYRLMGNRIIFE